MIEQVPSSSVPPDDSDGSIPARFRAQAARTPDAIAVRSRAADLTYADLDHWSDAIAAQLLQDLDYSCEPVPFLLPQSPLAIACTLGVLKSGKFYVPLDPSWKIERTAEIVGRLAARLVVVDPEFAGFIRGCMNVPVFELRSDPPTQLHAVDVGIRPDQPAYVYFTSGTTGPPKGVIDSHRNVLHNVMRYTRGLQIQADDRLTLLQSCGFSGAVSSMFGALLNGATSCPLDMRGETPARVAHWLEAERITIYHSVPSLFQSVAPCGGTFEHVRVVRLEGDLATRRDLELFRKHFTNRSRLAIGLGTTETGLACQYFYDHTMPLPDGVVPIGRPVTDMDVEVVSDDGSPAPCGAPGQIVVKSPFLAIGYWKDGDATSRAFTPAEPGASSRCYRTGDRGRVNAAGDLEYLGRLNGLVRVRGQWIELADLDAALCGLAGVREGTVATFSKDDTHVQLVAYYVPRDGCRPTTSDLRRELSRRVPTHSLPSRFIQMDRLPVTANGKVDRAALPAPDSVRPDLRTTLVLPINLVQLRISELWTDLLGVAPIGIRDDFFELGGDSLLAVVMIDRIEAILGRPIPMTALLDEGGVTVERLAWLAVNDSPEMITPIVPISAGNGRRMFFLHGDYFSGGLYCRELVRHLRRDLGFVAIPPCGLDGQPVPRTYQAMAVRHLRAIREIQPHGPYLLGGECNGGLVAYEIARLLEADGEIVDLLTLLSASAQNFSFARLPRWLEGLRRSTLVPGPYRPEGYRDRLRTIYQQIDREYLPGRYNGHVTLIFGREETPSGSMERNWWRAVAADVDLVEVPGDNRTKLTRYVDSLAAVINHLLETRLPTAAHRPPS
jgi:amino acid adenylation domain-containing protein